MTQKRSQDKPESSSLLRLFDRASDGKKTLICIAVMLAVVYALFWGVIVHNRPFGLSGDTEAAFQWKRALDHVEETEKVEPLWVPYIYGGMPVFGSLLFPRTVNYIEEYVLKGVFGNLLFAFSEAHYILLHVLLAGVFMFLLARSLGFTHLVSLLAGVVFMMYPHAISNWESFHWSKLATWSFTPLLFLLTVQLFEKRSLLVLGLLAAAIGTMLLNRHPQMAFYGMLAVGAYVLYEGALSLRKDPKRVLWAGLLLAVAVVVGLSIYAYEMLPTREYAEYSVRGGGSENPGGGANYDWATSWSQHPLEMLTLVVPSFFGFSSQVLSEWQGRPMALPLYWGWLPFTDSPSYLGIVPLVLALVALARRRNRMTWFLAVFSLLVAFIAFGRHFPLVYDLFFNYFPYFNKFRAPSLVLYVLPFSVGLLSLYGLSYIIETGRSGGRDAGGAELAGRLRVVLIAAGAIFAAVLVGKGVLGGFLGGFMFEKEGEVQRYGREVVDIFRQKRYDLFWKDLLKIVAFIGVIFGLCLLYARRKLSESGMVLGLVVLCFVDLYLVGSQFVNTRPQNEITDRLKPDPTVEFLKRDTTVYRVLSVDQNLMPVMDNDLMNNQIQSVSGYSPAKLRIYQEMLDSALRHPTEPGLPLNLHVLGMLNAKYVISPIQLPPLLFNQVYADPAKRLITFRFQRTLQRAWFVDSAVTATDRAQMYAYMNSPGWQPNVTAILNDPVPPELTAPQSSWVRISSYASREIILRAYTSSPALLVLSEVYYPAGWSATVDGAPVTIHRTNGVLRSVMVPAGEHDVRFAFEPQTYELGSTVTAGGWVLVVLLIGVGAFRDERIRKYFGR